MVSLKKEPVDDDEEEKQDNEIDIKKKNMFSNSKQRK